MAALKPKTVNLTVEKFFLQLSQEILNHLDLGKRPHACLLDNWCSALERSSLWGGKVSPDAARRMLKSYETDKRPFNPAMFERARVDLVELCEIILEIELG